MNIDLQNKTALVTGASRGIGRQIALQLRTCGAFVIGTATSEGGAQAISDYLGEGGKGMRLNILEQQSARSFFDTCPKNIDILVNNAGVTQDTLIMRMDDDDWNRVIETNLTGVYRMVKGVVRYMVKSRYGRIINISSVVAHSGNAGQVNYTASKGGLEAMTKSLAKELGGRNILVNCVAPGFIETDMTAKLEATRKDALLATTALNRLGKPQDIAHCVAFLCSDYAGYITGTTVHVNGGMW